jgi:xylulokinase
MRFDYDEKLLRAAGIDRHLLPDIIPSTGVVGTLTTEASAITGLSRDTKVICGGVDNACMALGAMGIKNGRVYTNLGSSAWIAITTDKPLIDTRLYTNVFAHILPGMYTSAATIFSAGNAFRWLRDTVCPYLVEEAQTKESSAYELMTKLAEASPLGANKLIFNPTLAMGTMLDNSVNIKGGFIGIDLRHDIKDLIRAAMEGITLSLGRNLGELKKLYPIADEMLLVGGGSASDLWLQMFADIYNMKIVRTNVGQNAGALGAAATAAVGAGLWDDFAMMETIHKTEKRTMPIKENVKKYREIMKIYKLAARYLGYIGDKLDTLEL